MILSSWGFTSATDEMTHIMVAIYDTGQISSSPKIHFVLGAFSMSTDCIKLIGVHFENLAKQGGPKLGRCNPQGKQPLAS